MKPFEPGDKVVVKGLGKHSRGVFLREWERPAGILYDTPLKLIEYRCDYNKSIHTVVANLVRHPIKPRVKKGAIAT